LYQLDNQTLRSNPELKKSGVYKIYLYRKNKPISIKRFLNTDNSGLIYIGAAEKRPIYNRLCCFIKSINPNVRQNNHSGGKKVKENKMLLKHIGNSKLMFEYILTKKAKFLEKREIKNYSYKYGETPPLNG